MSKPDKTDPTRRRRSLVRPLLRFLYYASLALGKRILTLAYTGIFILIMGRAVRGRADTKNDSAASQEQPAPAESEATCPICQEPIGERKPEGIVESWSILPCGHSFGSYCIKHYLGIAAEERPLCPICRQSVHHQCGHPTLPVIVTSSGPEPGRKPTSQPAQRDPGAKEVLLSLPCKYCQPKEGLPDDQSGSRWTIPFRPLRRLRRLTALFGRSRHRTSSSAQQIRNLISNGEGPWIDRFPRQRDLAWESWWKDQEPQGV